MKCRFLWVCVMLFWGFSPCDFHTLTASWMEERLFLRARCKAKCLRLFQNERARSAFSLSWQQFGSYNRAFDLCFGEQSEQCSSQCFMACDQPPDQCKLTCSENKGLGCSIGCRLLRDSVEPRPGECPVDLASNPVNRDPPNSLLGGQCSRLCLTDAGCEDPLHKCCHVGCSRFCTQPTFNDSVPPLATALKPISGEATTAPLVVLDWSQRYTQSDPEHGPIVFILQTRICACKHFDESQLTDWQTLVMTHQFNAQLDAFEPGRMYQFRVAAVSPYGSRGFGPASEPYPPAPPPAPSPPGVPRNVTDWMWRYQASGMVHVLVRWTAPEHSDLPVAEYSVKWAVDHGYLQPGGQSFESLTQYTKTLPATENQLVIQNLSPSTSYKVQVRAISYWYGHGPLESQPNTIFISTKSAAPVFASQARSEHQFPNIPLTPVNPQPTNTSGCECRTEWSQTNPLVLQKMFYDNGELVATFTFTQPSTVRTNAYLLEWAPQVCINPREENKAQMRQTLKIQSKTRTVFLNSLQFGCRYVVRLRPYLHDPSFTDQVVPQPVMSVAFQADTPPPTLQSCFCTPSCADVEVNRGPPPPNCTAPDPGPPLPPTGLQVEKREGLNYRLSWKPPGQTVGPIETSSTMGGPRLTLPVAKYRIIWAPRVDEPVSRDMYNDAIGFSPIMDVQKSDARIVSMNHTRIDLHNLKPDTFYVVRVQAIGTDVHSQDQESLPASLYFVTPKMDKSQLTSGLETSQRSSTHRSLTLSALTMFSLLLWLTV